MTKLTQKEAEKLPKEVLHEIYISTVKMMLLDFFVDSTRFFNEFEEESVSVKHVQDFIEKWVSDRFMETREDWNPNEPKTGSSK